MKRVRKKSAGGRAKGGTASGTRRGSSTRGARAGSRPATGRGDWSGVGGVSTSPPSVDDIIARLRRAGSAAARRQMSERFGIRGRTAETALGVSMAVVQKLARELRVAPGRKAGAAEVADAKGRNHALAAALWDTAGREGCYDARQLAVYVDEPELVTSEQMDAWCREFDNWATCDTACFRLFDKAPPVLVLEKVRLWSGGAGAIGGGDDEFVTRAAYALLASFALHARKDQGRPDDGVMIELLDLVELGALDSRNFVKKGVNWALRGMGKWSPRVRKAAIATARRLAASEHASARWVGKDALRELTK